MYVSRKDRGRGLASIEDSINASIEGLQKYSKKSKEKLITAAINNDGIIKTNRKNNKV